MMTALLLRQVPLFRSLDDAQVEALAAVAMRRQYARGRVIVLAEQQGDEFFAISRGQVKVTLSRADGRQIILALLGPGAVFGELSLLDGKPRSATVTVTEDAELVTVPRAAFLALLRREPKVAVALLGELAARLRRTDLQIANMALCNVTHRVTSTILQLVADHGVPTAEGLLLERRPTHEELASMAGTTRETVTRVLGRLERDGYLVSRGRRLLVLREPEDEAQEP